MFKAKMIKDNESLLALPEGTPLLIMGTKTGKQLKQTGEIKAENKMEIEEPLKIPQRYGLVNIGNTCYMNAAIQLLRSIPQLNECLKNFKITNNQNLEQVLVKNLNLVFNVLQNKDFSP